MAKKIVIVGGGFAGLNAAKVLGRARDTEVTLIDKNNHHLFQPLLYQVAMAGLSPAEIAVPIRTLLSPYPNIRVLLGEVHSVDLKLKKVSAVFGDLAYDRLLLSCGVIHSYFGKPEWETFAPGLKTVEQATEIRRRVLTAFEEAEREIDPNLRRKHLTFVIIGGGPTGVELAGALGEMSRFTLRRDFHNIDPRHTRIILVEAGKRILPSFDPILSARVMRDLEALGVQVWTESRVTALDASGVQVDRERIETSTVLWAAGIEGPGLNRTLGLPLDPLGRLPVASDLSLTGHPEVFVAGDQSRYEVSPGNALPCMAPVALQEGRCAALNILRDLNGEPRLPFRFLDKGQMAAIGRNKAVAEFRGFKMGGFIAWLIWLFIHIYYLTGFKNRMFVILQWGLSYFTFRRGARLILGKEWRMFGSSLYNSGN